MKLMDILGGTSKTESLKWELAQLRRGDYCCGRPMKAISVGPHYTVKACSSCKRRAREWKGR